MLKMRMNINSEYETEVLNNLQSQEWIYNYWDTIYVDTEWLWRLLLIREFPGSNLRQGTRYLHFTQLFQVNVKMKL